MNIPHHSYHHPSRRRVLNGFAIAGLLGVGLNTLRSIGAFAADAAGWPVEAFKQKTEADALKSLFGKSAEASDKVKLDAPEIAENGAVVPISISTSLPNVTSISVLVHENPYALAASYKIPEGTIPAVSNRLKMAKTSNVVAIVESDGKLYSASKEVKVTVGGCGG
ncbi:thiosulfate oxidation carrier protein SoxY [Tardiphaga sp. vice304]|uniref:thiosulfate oxidation carrier protein SoxY n=1 Tax=unclassified Tardiphaga TaxID=2631404 RepID=UPI001162F1DA|nr:MULTISPECIES: thiosulfate oxidation carrier protein SoxY [unclassified Tardiphaga]MBC7576301.1 thiosulfate oxidation carrier protein SoxY [Tardiphaga sp.]QDM16094.1 thiosulfate oxidation carrier protein SoxY [Tardiphaga sp. vice278]QDM26300.1 thiosulfate oxidation carrier protein SoxY [Tardiphaga sp. vice304]